MIVIRHLKSVKIPRYSYNLVMSSDSKLDKETMFYILYVVRKFSGWDGVTANVSSKVLQKKIYNYEKYVHELKLIGALEVINSYKLPKKVNGKVQRGEAKQYRIILPKVKYSGIEAVFEITKKPEIECSQYLFSDRFFDELKPNIRRQIILMKEKVKIDPDIKKLKEALHKKEVRNDLPKGYVEELFEPLDKLEKGKTGGTLSSTDRIFTTFTRLSSQLRYYVTIDNERLVELDLSNSQIFFLYLLIRKKKPGLLKCEDVRLFGELVATGKFYEHILSKYNELYPEVGATRNLIKSTILQAFFSKEKNKNGKTNSFRKKTRTVFEACFPSVYSFISDRKSRYFKNLSRELQRNEAEVFTDKLLNACKEIDILTVHDAAYCKASDGEKVRNVLAEIFKDEYGLMPNIKVDVAKRPSVKSFVDRKREKTKMEKRNYSGSIIKSVSLLLVIFLGNAN